MTPLAQIITGRLLTDGSMPFSSFMAAALYHQEHGYYTSTRGRTGRAGDFFTSVSVGAVFGQIMAGEFCAAWERLGKPGPFTLLEAGANDGQFALDVLNWANQHRPDFMRALVYKIVELQPGMAALQLRTLAAYRSQVTHDSLGAEAHGCYFANELLDAIPCRRVRFTGGRWQELHVGLD